MITSASAHLDSVCCMTVLPAPKGPGMAAVAPRAAGKRTSMRRCPVTSGSRGSKRWTSGREKRTGQVCMSRSSRPSSSRPTTSVTRTAPPRISLTPARAAPGGLYRAADVQARGVLVDLDKGGIAVEADDLPDQPLLADAHNVVHARAGHAAGDDRRAGNLEDSACDGHVRPPSTPALPPP